MADDMLTVADLVAFELGLAHNELLELKAAAPTIAALPAIPASDGAVHKYVKTTQLPVVGFRAENNGRDFDHTEDELVTEACKILDWSFAVDKAVADSRGRERVVAREQMRHIQAALFEMEKQTINGTANNAAGFNGWADSTFLDQAADEMVIDAGGATNASSCYLIRANDMECASVYAGDRITEQQDTVVQDLIGANSMHLPVYYTPGSSFVCTQHGSKYSIARIANLDGGANTLTDDLIYDAIALFPAGFGPTHAVMNTRSLMQLRQSRTATNATGAPAPIPTYVGDGNVMVIATDAITNAETVVAAVTGGSTGGGSAKQAK